MIVREAYLDVFHPIQDAGIEKSGNYQVVRLDLPSAETLFMKLLQEYLFDKTIRKF